MHRYSLSGNREGMRKLPLRCARLRQEDAEVSNILSRKKPFGVRRAVENTGKCGRFWKHPILHGTHLLLRVPITPTLEEFALLLTT